MAFTIGRLPQDNDELWLTVRAMWGVSIPREQVCPDHVAPFTAFSDAYFRRNSLDPDSPVQSIALWKGSRGLSGKCGSWSRPVLLADGTRDTWGEMVGRTEEILTPTGTAKASFTDNGIEPLYRVSFGSGMVADVTGHHKFLLADKNVRRKQPQPIPRGFIEADQMAAGDLVACATEMPVHGSRRVEPGRIVAAALLIGDGSMTSKATSLSQVGAEVTAWFTDAVEQLGGRVRHGAQHNHFVLGDCALPAMLADDGLRVRSEHKRLPDWVFTLPRPDRVEFLRALLATDAEMVVKNAVQVIYSSASQQLIRDVQLLGWSLGLPGRISCKTERGYRKGGRWHPCLDSWEWRPIGDAVHDLVALVGHVPGRSQFFADYAAFAQRGARHTWRTRNARPGEFWDDVVSVEPLGEGPTVCLSVDSPDHEFVTPMVEHNSYLLSILGLTVSFLLGSDVNLLGGSLAQSTNIHLHMRAAMESPNAPRYMIVNEGMLETKLTNGAKVRPLTASQRTVRGPHPPTLLLDEIDEMDLPILDAALGQPMPQINYLGQRIKPFTVMCVVGSTMILTPRGEVRIDAMAPGNRVWTRWGWRRVMRVLDNGRRPVVDVVLSNGRTLTCTDDHRIAVPGGWMTPRQMSAGQVVDGVDSDLVLTQPGHAGASVPFDAVPSGLVAVPDPSASPTFPSALAGGCGVALSERVSLGAVGLESVPRPDTVTAGNVLPHRDGLEVGRVAAGSTGAASRADVVDGELVGNRADQFDIGPAVQHTSIIFPVEVAIPAGLGAAPHPTAARVYVTPSTEPVHVVRVLTARDHVAPVYDLEIEDVHEYVANSIVIHNCSTWQHPEGTFTEVMRRAEENGYPVYSWCFLETSAGDTGWLSQDTIDEKRQSIPAEMWRVEYELGEPAIGNRAFDTAAVDAAFCVPFKPDLEPTAGGYVRKKVSKDFEEYTFALPDKYGSYIAGADWGKEQDKTVLWVARIDGLQRELVYFMRVNRRPYPQMIGWFNDVIKRYDVGTNGAWHDSTGLGNVVNDYLDMRARPFPMTGDKRAIMLSDYVNAVERGRWKIPRIKSAYLEHKYARVGDLYSSRLDYHLPDTVCAAALAEYACRRAVGASLPIVIPRNPDLTPLQANFAHVPGTEDQRLVSEPPISLLA